MLRNENSRRRMEIIYQCAPAWYWKNGYRQAGNSCRAKSKHLLGIIGQCEIMEAGCAHIKLSFGNTLSGFVIAAVFYRHEPSPLQGLN
jgi:hypothetical protein